MSSKVTFPKRVSGRWVEREADVEYEVLLDGKWEKAHVNSCDNPLGELWTVVKGKQVKIPPEGWRFKKRNEQRRLF